MEKTLLLWIEIVLASERTANRTGKENCSVFVPRVFSSASCVLRCLAHLPLWLAYCASPILKGNRERQVLLCQRSPLYFFLNLFTCLARILRHFEFLVQPYGKKKICLCWRLTYQKNYYSASECIHCNRIFIGLHVTYGTCFKF